MFKVEWSEHCDDIEYWINRRLAFHKECPVSVKIENNQPIITSGTITAVVFFYEEQDDDENDYEDDQQSWIAPDINEGSVDGLAGYGGRL